MAAIIILLGIIAVGVLLQSEPGKRILRSAWALTWIVVVGGIVIGLLVLLWGYLQENATKILEIGGRTALVLLIGGLLGWIGQQMHKYNQTSDDKLNVVGLFVKHTGTLAMVLYVIGFFLFAGIISHIVQYGV